MVFKKSSWNESSSNWELYIASGLLSSLSVLEGRAALGPYFHMEAGGRIFVGSISFSPIPISGCTEALLPVCDAEP